MRDSGMRALKKKRASGVSSKLQWALSVVGPTRPKLAKPGRDGTGKARAQAASQHLGKWKSQGQGMFGRCLVDGPLVLCCGLKQPEVSAHDTETLCHFGLVTKVVNWYTSTEYLVKSLRDDRRRGASSCVMAVDNRPKRGFSFSLQIQYVLLCFSLSSSSFLSQYGVPVHDSINLRTNKSGKSKDQWVGTCIPSYSYLYTICSGA